MLERLRTQAIASRSGFSLDARILRPDGQQRWMRIVAGTASANGRAVRLYGMKQDITAEKAQWEQLRRLAEHDALTGLANRARFHADFLDLSAGCDTLAAVGALVLFDLNNLKTVNDRLGHAAGDRYISSFGERLTAAFPQALLVTRIGGDEFAVLLPAVLSPGMAERLVRRRIPTLSAPLHTAEWTLPLAFSADMAFNHPGCKATPDALFAVADEALYTAKREGGTALCLAGSAGQDDRRRA
jgi:diguanylate cyclase (GGDEF)-like protein